MNRYSKIILAVKDCFPPEFSANCVTSGHACPNCTILSYHHNHNHSLEMLGKSGRLFVVLAHCHSRVGTTYQLPTDPALKIYHMALRTPLLCFGK